MAKTGLFADIGKALGQFNTDPSSLFNHAVAGDVGDQPHMSEAVMGFPSVNMSGGPAAPSDGSDINVVGDGWKPHKQTILGAIADAYLMSRGRKPAFADAREQRNMMEAMQGLTQNPKQVIDRMSRIKGHGDDAWKMYNEYADNSRQDANLDRQNNIFDMKKEELVYNRIAGMMGAANKDTWGKMRVLAQQTANKYGVNIDDVVPQDFDPDSIEYIRAGAIKPKDQERIAQGDRRLDQADTRITETGRHNQATEGQAATNETGRNVRHDNPVARPSASKTAPKPFMTKYGVMNVTSDGNHGVIKRDGKAYGYALVNGTWVPIGEVKSKK